VENVGARVLHPGADVALTSFAANAAGAAPTALPRASRDSSARRDR
jgi:hypothetical protein